MPIYEYQCDDCQNQVEIFFRSFSDLDTKTPTCPECQGQNLERLISNVAIVEGGDSVTNLPNTSASATVTNDSKTLAQTMRRASQKSGQDLGNDFKEVASRLERGESARSVETSLRKRVGEKMDPH